MISVKQCLEALHRGDTVSMVVVTYDKRRPEKCGRRLVIEACQLMWGTTDDEKAATPTKKAQAAAAPLLKRNPNHGKHYSRNVRVVVNGLLTEIVHKIHPPLIVEFNGQTVCP